MKYANFISLFIDTASVALLFIYPERSMTVRYFPDIGREYYVHFLQLYPIYPNVFDMTSCCCCVSCEAKDDDCTRCLWLSDEKRPKTTSWESAGDWVVDK
jgi:hypothetical protein